MLTDTTPAKEFKYTLTNTDNYLITLNSELNGLLKQQLNLANEYTKCMSEMYITTHTNNKNHFYIYIKGLETIYHVFDNLIYYTKNIHLTRDYCQKAIYFYIEFVNQIMDESNVFLKLNISDAVLFIYKKTIFDINKSLCKNLENNPPEREKRIYDTLIIHENIIKMVISYIYYNKSDDCDDDTENDIKPSSHPFETILTSLDSILITLNNIIIYDFSYKNYCNLFCLTELLQEYFNNIYTQEQYLECVSKFCKNIKNLDISPEIMREKIYMKQIFAMKPIQLIKLFE